MLHLTKSSQEQHLTSFAENLAAHLTVRLAARHHSVLLGGRLVLPEVMRAPVKA